MMLDCIDTKNTDTVLENVRCCMAQNYFQLNNNNTEAIIFSPSCIAEIIVTWKLGISFDFSGLFKVKLKTLLFRIRILV